ncbi:GNAT family N-acetyltransferase [Caminibacter sp.]
MVIEKLNKFHDKEKFDCGNLTLNEFLKKYAYQNQHRYLIGVTYVIHIDNEIIGYITLSASSIKKTNINSKKPYKDIPALRIARLAVDEKHQNKGIGKKLLKFAINKALELKESYGCVGIVVDAKEEAKKFYEKYGFIEIKTLEKHLTTPMYLSMKSMQTAKNS